MAGAAGVVGARRVAPAAPDAPRIESDFRGQPMEQRTLLVVEDHAALRDTLAENLRAEGYRVLTAGDGVAALEIARREPIALIVLDLMLPRLDGLEVCRQLRG